MCLLFALSDTSKISKLDLERLLLRVNSEFQLSQRDGFGFALHDSTSKSLYVERYVNPRDFCGVGRMPEIIEASGWLGRYAAFSDWEQHGNWTDARPAGPMIVHGRTSTGDVELRNTHPFIKNEWCLAHNGIVEWHGEKLPLSSTCDSEHLLNCYVHQNGARSFADNLSGWFATLAIDPQGRLRVAKCAATDLYFAWCDEWQTYVMATKPLLFSQLEQTLLVKMSRPLPLESYTEITFSGNDLHSSRFFHPPAISRRLVQSASKALGKEITAKPAKARFDMDTGDEADLRRELIIEDLVENMGYSRADVEHLSTRELETTRDEAEEEEEVAAALNEQVNS